MNIRQMSEPQPDDVTAASGTLAALSAVADMDPRWSRRGAVSYALMACIV
ncbi:MAG TPA: hypothetical protein VGO16_03430 [Pseudonocardiaceae bacterium]|nr:hypothetical protein [Pseudonocardiaceae bacterium]